MANILWQLQNVSLVSSGHRRLAGIHLALTEGVTAVLGESGAGKTSLLNLLVGLDEPTSGSLAGEDVWAADGQDASRPFVFWVPQDHGLWPHLSVEEHLSMVMSQSRASEGDPVTTLLRTFELTDRRGAKPAQLSQGERARLSVARALAAGARVQVMDEPLAHVDSARRAMFWSAIEQLIKQAGASWVFATHDPQTVLAHADHVIALQDGEVLYHGDVTTLYHDPPSEKAARCLGEVNWLTAAEAACWLPSRESLAVGGPNSANVSVRPEQLEIRVDSAGALVVESFVFRGPTSHVKLHHTEHQTSRHFAVRTPAATLHAGDRVSLHDLRVSGGASVD